MKMNGLCHDSSWGLLGNLGGWSWVGLVLNLVFWVGLIAGLILLFLWAIRRARVPAPTLSNTSGQPTAKEILQAQYARGEITRDQYELRKQEV